MASTPNYITRGGITPNQNSLPYSITTSDVETYLQKKVDVVVSDLRKKGMNIADIDVHVTTSQAGEKFLPFIVVLPMSALKDNMRKNNDEPSIFNPKESDRSANMIDGLYYLFRSFIYDKGDEAAFFSDDWRRQRGVARGTSEYLRTLRTPKITTVPINNTRMEMVVFMIDPLRIFHDMLVMGNDKNFRVEITNWKKLSAGEYQYDMNRRVNTKNKQGYNNTLADELDRKFRGFVRR